MPVYFIVQNSPGEQFLKIGRAGLIRRRLGALQTGNPYELQIVGWINARDDAALEKKLHDQFRARRRSGEWFAIEPADILSALKTAGQQGFVAKNTNAFEIVGYDKDAIPECLGVWEWADLEMDECCPYCGCMCGMHFQDASQLFHCINCDTLTGFEDGPGGFG